MPKIAASVLNADFSKWKQWLPELESAKVDRIQFDIMDGKYVHNAGVDKKHIRTLRPETKLLFESHLMVRNPEAYVREFAEIGNTLLIFHVETTKAPLRLIETIVDHGMKAGIAINNKNPAKEILPYLGHADLALVMSVEAGLGGQEFNPKALEKISAIRKKIDADGALCEIEVDGGINAGTAKKCVQAGANILVAGTFLFRHPKGVKAAVKELQEAP
ncbi:MAG: ribulose-phosphate 3-epimerase [Candidatus Diapherotrites archaeon]|uniref:Ribulose-phosphate 3-epimerase n=1 Tax=Candidatus Iainarchaeum sp. TaxID=3101447 RepID=A0A8T3YJ18_9ARCH|nr:ribulose-phosphate 3-epimerase [Candidatus Diapherotrites archaeon]